ncbi:MAG TPA: hypothetical protein PKM38_06295, partial [Syntrophorhabdaceae bacterium]|nr:hypothetical protein [Syntrophorhabdaceae bacterium]
TRYPWCSASHYDTGSRHNVKVRSLLCHVTVAVAEVARFIGMAPSATNYSVTWGKKIAKEMGLQKMEELVNN